MDSYLQIVILIVAVIAGLGIASFIRKSPKSDVKSTDHDLIDDYHEFSGDTIIDFNEEFYKQADGREVCHFANCGNYVDAHAIQSRLYSADIMCHIDSEHLNAVYGGTPMKGVTDVRLMIYQNDLDEAIELVNIYLKESRQNGFSKQEFGINKVPLELF